MLRQTPTSPAARARAYVRRPTEWNYASPASSRQALQAFLYLAAKEGNETAANALFLAGWHDFQVPGREDPGKWDQRERDVYRYYYCNGDYIIQYDYVYVYYQGGIPDIRFKVEEYAGKYASGVLCERIKACSLDVAVQQWLDVLNASPRQGMALSLSVKTADYHEPAQLELLGGPAVAECIGKAILEMECPLSLFDDVQLELGGVALPLDTTLEQNDIEMDARLIMSLTMNGNEQIQALFRLATTVAQTGNSTTAPQPHAPQGNVASSSLLV